MYKELKDITFLIYIYEKHYTHITKGIDKTLFN